MCEDLQFATCKFANFEKKRQIDAGFLPVGCECCFLARFAAARIELFWEVQK